MNTQTHIRTIKEIRNEVSRHYGYDGFSDVPLHTEKDIWVETCIRAQLEALETFATSIRYQIANDLDINTTEFSRFLIPYRPQ